MYACVRTQVPCHPLPTCSPSIYLNSPILPPPSLARSSLALHFGILTPLLPCSTADRLLLLAASSPAMAFQSPVGSPFDCLLIDLDDTLYPGNTGIGPALRRNIDEFLVARFGLAADKAAALRADLFRSHGSTLAGLVVLGHDVHPDEYHSYVHGRLPYDVITTDPQLAAALQSMPQRKILFTNSDRAHMKRALERLGVDEACFDGVVCFETMNPHLFGEELEGEDDEAAAADVDRPAVVLKPSVHAFVAALRVAGTNPGRTLFLDDSERNIAAGKALGLRTNVQVGKRARSKEADYALESIGGLRRAIPEIWGGDGELQPDHNVEKNKSMRADLDAVIQPTSIQA
ncbi:unnamed protein product [Triticum turgidum subsp. durum]|uniref:Uncharacterized protein n=1 Tax=Triticum turgidum subsp. durum TaxID=4567 RepID=A0A9R0W1I9_TRITD|nr:unnamed protein product [Triticum turgidum subsp. durum]